MIYLVFLIIWAVMAIVVYFQTKGDRETTSGEPTFGSPFHQEIYRLSFIAPFKWFVEDDRNLTPKGEKVKELLKLSGYDKNYTVRSFMAFKVLIFFASMVMVTLALFLMEKLPTLMNTAMNIQNVTAQDSKGVPLNVIFITIAFFMMFALFPSIKMKNIAKKSILARSRDLPMIYMFTILMLRSNKTVTEIIYALTKLNTHYKEVFERGYRMYLRNKHEGMAYLRSQFDNDRFAEMFNLLEDIAEYAKDECVSIMESNMKNLVDETNMVKRRNDLSQLVYSQASMVIPFMAIILLGAAPVVIMGITIFTTSMNM
ncbi:hypothetical protein ACFVS2_21485 [Brevibacillus sp. NPDC058079]|uniref:hypothetical protein n=1 Tax=Brevibacillus sp. NPDC058079 TaxID=3346330 RepID=UPI0036E16CB1